MDHIIMYKDVEKAEKELKHLKKVRNKACSVIEDAKARYIKSKTRVRSKKATIEKDAVLNSPRFDVLKDYEKKEDIQECYGWDFFDEAERDRLEELWDEREEIKNHTVDGLYEDDVTKALDYACNSVLGIWEDDIETSENLIKAFNEQMKEFDKSEV